MRTSVSSQVLAFFLQHAKDRGWNSLSDAYADLRKEFPDTADSLFYSVKARADKALRQQRRGPQPDHVANGEATASLSVESGLTADDLKSVRPKLRKKIQLIVKRLEDAVKDNEILRLANNGKAHKARGLRKASRQSEQAAVRLRTAFNGMIEGILDGRSSKEIVKETVVSVLDAEG